MSPSNEGAVNGAPSLSTRIANCAEELKSLSDEVGQNESARKQLLGVCQQASTDLERPADAIWRYIMVVSLVGVIKAAVQMGLVDALNGSEQPQTAADLATTTNQDSMLITRILRPLAAIHIVNETGYQTYQAGPVCKALGIPPLRAGLLWTSGANAGPSMKLGDYVVEHGAKDLDTPNAGIWQYSHNTDLSLFAWLHKHPADHKIFDTFMTGQRNNRADWFDVFPTQTILLDGASTSDPSSALMVDIAGGIGGELGAFAARYPSAPGKLILQDLPETIANSKPTLSSAITPMAHDIFTPQPVIGARAYYFRAVFHDWPDAKCVEILKNTAKAMKKGYSKLLIHEWVLPDVGAPLQGSLLDTIMMTLLGGCERTETMWRDILGKAGLKIEKIWVDKVDSESLIEAVLED